MPKDIYKPLLIGLCAHLIGCVFCYCLYGCVLSQWSMKLTPFKNLMSIAAENETLRMQYFTVCEICLEIIMTRSLFENLNVWRDVMSLAVHLQIPLNIPVGQKRGQVGVKWKIRKHHDLFRQVGSENREHVERHKSIAHSSK